MTCNIKIKKNLIKQESLDVSFIVPVKFNLDNVIFNALPIIRNKV